MPARSPEELFAQANNDFLQGYLRRSQDEARQAFQKYFSVNPDWAEQFRLVEAKAALWRGLYGDVFELLNNSPDYSNRPNLLIWKLTLLSIANINIHKFDDAEQMLQEASGLCDTSQEPGCGYMLQARGLLASEIGRSADAEQFYKLSLSFARLHRDRFLEANSLLNLGDESLSQSHFDEAVDRSEDALNIANAEHAGIPQLVTKGNIGWAYYKLGDSEKALDLSLEAESSAAELGDVFDEENELTNLGYIYMDQRKLDLAQRSFQEALHLAQSIKAKQDIYNALRVLARLSLETGDVATAGDYATQALDMARQSANHMDELYPVLVEGQIAAQRRDFNKAESTFRQVENDKACPVFLKWEAQHSLARLYEESKPVTADREYRAALRTFEAARANVHHEDFQLSFLTNAAEIYDDYVNFLVAHGKVAEALRWADYSRARTLSEGLGLLPRESVRTNTPSISPPTLNLRDVAARANGIILYYWLGTKRSYLWAITKQKTALFTLLPAAEINTAVERYRRVLMGPQEALDSSEGVELFRTLIAPATALLSKNARVFIVPDGSLNSLNFETLVVPAPKRHYWIEDADVVNASSLRLLAASFSTESSRPRRLLLIGDSVPPNNDYPALPQAAGEVASVAKYFPGAEQKIYTREQATPAAYLRSHPEQFSYIHFVAHGTASRLSPLDSAIVLSRDPSSADSFKLYARDITKQPLRAELVTISACYGAGERAYSGEGLVGLAWAFLRTGAHYVVAALWEVSDASTIQFMDRFYQELKDGQQPDVALRNAKLSLIHSNGVFRKPFYWAPFQLYTGRDSPTTNKSLSSSR